MHSSNLGLFLGVNLSLDVDSLEGVVPIHESQRSGAGVLEHSHIVVSFSRELCIIVLKRSGNLIKIGDESIFSLVKECSLLHFEILMYS